MGGVGGDDGIRTHDPLLAGQVLSQLSYTPTSSAHPVRDLNPLRSFVRNCPRSLAILTGSSKIEQQRFVPANTLLCLPPCERSAILLRKEVIQPHLPIRLPCYDLTPIIEPTFGHFLLAVRTWTSGVLNFHGLTGGVYKTRERIHRSMLICDY